MVGSSQQSPIAPNERLRRAAIVLSSLPPSTAAKLLRGINPEIQARLQRTAQALLAIDATERVEVLREFRQQMFAKPLTVGNEEAGEREAHEYQDEFEVGSKNNRPHSGSADLLNSQVASVVSQWELPRSFHAQSLNESPFAFLDDADDEIVVELLAREHAQTIALVFSSITPKQAARILPRLDLSVQSETVRRIGRLEDIPAATVAEVASHLRHRVAELEHEANNPGHRTLKAIMDAMPLEPDDRRENLASGSDHHQPLMDLDIDESLSKEAVPESDKEPAEESLSTDDVHQHLIQLPPRALCQALGKVKTREALLTLCGLPNQVAETTLSMLPRSKAKEVRRGMANLTSVRLREIDEAKEAVALASLEFDQHRFGSTPVAA